MSNYDEKGRAKVSKYGNRGSHIKREIKGKTGLTLQQEEAIALLLHRDVNGMTYEDIAKTVGINKATLWRWRQSKEFNNVMLEQSEEIQRNFLNEAYTSLRQMLVDPKTKSHNKLKAIELVMKNQGRLKDVSENKHEVDTPNMDDLIKRIEDL